MNNKCSYPFLFVFDFEKPNQDVDDCLVRSLNYDNQLYFQTVRNYRSFILSLDIIVFLVITYMLYKVCCFANIVAISHASIYHSNGR